MATLFSMLSSDASVDTLITLCITEECYSFFCQVFKYGMEVDTCSAFCENLSEVSPEFVNLILCVMHFPNSLLKDIILFLRLCSSMVIYIHDHHVPPEQAQLIPLSYNPPQYGRAYYFENHEHQIRQMRKVERMQLHHYILTVNRHQTLFYKTSPAVSLSTATTESRDSSVQERIKRKDSSS